MTEHEHLDRLSTGVPNLDAVLGGGLPKGSVAVIFGPPGSGKTILAQQLCFHNASPDQRVLFFHTLAEPTAKSLRFLREFTFFDQGILDAGLEYVDLGEMIQNGNLDAAFQEIVGQIQRVKPAIVVFDSFKAFDDLAETDEQFRAFAYQVTITLMAWEITGLLLGEYDRDDMVGNPLFAIADSLIFLHQQELSGEQQRFVQVYKLRGSGHNLDEQTFVISREGISVFAPRVIIRRRPVEEAAGGEIERVRTGVSKLDILLGNGIPRGTSVLVAGVAGTGKTVMLLECIYRGAKEFNERGLFISFEETESRLLAEASSLGWDLEGEIARGMVELVFISQPDIQIEANLFMIWEKMAQHDIKRLAIDSSSVFLHKVETARLVQDKIYQLATIVYNQGAIGFFAADIPYGSHQISRFGVEETIVDGVILLTSSEEGVERQRYVEVYKMRNCNHLKGRHSMTIGPGGLTVFPRYEVESEVATVKPSLLIHQRLSTGLPGLDDLIGGGIPDRSVTMVSGSAGIGKSTLGVHFLLAGAASGDRGLFISLEESPAQILATAKALGLPLQEAVDSGLIEIQYLSRNAVRAGQFLSLLTDTINRHKTRRLVFDGTTFIQTQAAQTEALQYLLHSLSIRFKSLGVTSVFTIDSPELYSTEHVAGMDLSPVADNLIMLRYARLAGRLQPTLIVVKSRGTWHDARTFDYGIRSGGIQIEGPRGGGEALPPPADEPPGEPPWESAA